MLLNNPLLTDNSKSRDPFIVLWNGCYYSCYNGVDSVVVRKFRSFAKITEAEEKKIFEAKEGQPYDWYAPEMHLIDGHWYIYGAPTYNEESSPSECVGVHTMHVLRSVGDDPFGEYEFMGAVRGLEGKWSIDGTVFDYNGRLYTALNMADGLRICEMSDPLTLKGEPRLLTTPELPWETVMTPIAEGPFALKRNEKLYIVYSASDSRCDDYCLGLLEFKGGDVLDGASWEKHPEPVFSKVDGLYGPGHCSFTKAGDKDMIVYHANTVSGSGWLGSYLCAQPIGWDGDLPIFGKPLLDFEI